MNKLTDDLSVITTIPEEAIRILLRKGEECIAHELFENPVKMDYNIGIGVLTIQNNNGDLIYSFTPNESLNDKCKQASKGDDPLTKLVEKRFIKQILHVYKDLI